MGTGIAQLGIGGGSQAVQHIPDAGEAAVTDLLVLRGKMVKVVGADHAESFPEVSVRNPDGKKIAEMLRGTFMECNVCINVDLDQCE